MGAGKTTIGRTLARKLGLEFIDTDHEIEARTGVSIPVIFEIEGEEGFRRREIQTIAEYVEDEATLDCLKEMGVAYAQGFYLNRPLPLSEALSRHMGTTHPQQQAASIVPDISI